MRDGPVSGEVGHVSGPAGAAIPDETIMTTAAASTPASALAPLEASAVARPATPDRSLDSILAAFPPALDELAREAARNGVSLSRAAVLGLCRSVLDEGRRAIEDSLMKGDLTGPEVVRHTTRLVDGLLAPLFLFVTGTVYPRANPTQGERLALVATGGYGRAELAPHSDLDLLFLLPYKRNAYTEQVIEYLLYLLWDLGFKVGQAVRSVDETLRQAGADITIRTSILETRLIAGEETLFETLRSRFRDEIAGGTGPEFVEAKLAERDERHRRLGDSRYVLEPNIKDGKGGLRDLHTLFWIAKYVYGVDDISALLDHGVISQSEARRFAKAESFLWLVRAYLHVLTGRAEERLTFDMQPRIAGLMGYTDHAGARAVERFMKHYFLHAKEVGDLTRIFCAALEDQHKRRPRLRLPLFGPSQREVEGFLIERGRIRAATPGLFERDPLALLRVFTLAQDEDLEIHPETLKRITRSLPLIDDALRNDPEANRLFLDLLTHRRNPETTLRLMNEAGVFARFVPDFGRVVAQMQYDMYHVYTVDEHTIRALGILHRLEEGLLRAEMPVASQVIGKIASRAVLYVALLLHDIAKGRGGDHSELGAGIALAFCPRLGMTDEETATVSWLVRHHLLMSGTAFRLDIDDPRTVADFVAEVRSIERLRLLLCLTVADIRAVGPNVWNGWKGSLLGELYHTAEDSMSGGLASRGREERARAAREALRVRLDGWDEARFAAHADRVPPAYWLAFDTDQLTSHALLADATGTAPLSIAWNVEPERQVTEVTIYTLDDAGLFSRIAGAMALAGASIVDAKIFTFADGMALDSFSIQSVSGTPFDDPAQLARMKTIVERVLSRQQRLPDRLALSGGPPSRTRLFGDRPRIVIDNSLSATNTVIEVDGRDRPGFLYDVTRALTALNLQISSAKIATYGTRAVDVFYVRDLFGLKVEHQSRLALIRDRLMQALQEDPEAGEDLAASPLPGRRG